jgi:DNA invertase Pin-like site-specific DNA recombinase
MPRAVIYLRVSTEDQAESGAGEAAQLDACRAWCDRSGLEPAGPHREQGGLSGATPFDRCPGLMNALAGLQPGDVLLVQKRDRVARSQTKIAMLEALLRNRKCRLVSAYGEGTDAPDPSDPMAFLQRGLADLFAEYERILIGWRTRMALAGKRRRGERVGRVPFGQVLLDDGRRSKRGNLPNALAESAEEINVLARMIELRRNGWAYGRIAEAVNHWGYRTKAGKPWQKSSVAYVVSKHMHKELENAAPPPPPATAGPA